MARVVLDRGERFLAERGRMVGMSDGAVVSTRMWGNPVRGMQRRLTRSGGMMINEYRGKGHGSEVLLAAERPGDIEPVELREGGLMVQPGSFLGSDGSVRTRGAWAGMAALLTGERGYFLRCAGDGLVLVSGFGAIHVMELGPDEGCVVERGCVVAYDCSVKFTVGRMGTLLNALLMRRLVTGKFRGPGRVLVETRNEGYFGRWLRGRLPELVAEVDVGAERGPQAADTVRTRRR